MTAFQPTRPRAPEDTKVLLLEGIHPLADQTLKGAGYQVTSLSRALDEDELISALDGVHLLGIRSKTQVGERAMEVVRRADVDDVDVVRSDQLLC